MKAYQEKIVRSLRRNADTSEWAAQYTDEQLTWIFVEDFIFGWRESTSTSAALARGRYIVKTGEVKARVHRNIKAREEDARA